MNLLDSNKSKIKKDKSDKNCAYLEIAEIVLIHVNVANNSYQQNSKVYIFVSNKSFGQLLDISPDISTFHSKFSYINIWFRDQNSNPIELEDQIHITLVIN